MFQIFSLYLEKFFQIFMLYREFQAGCILHLDVLGREEAQFPIFVTEPATPILYVSHSREHLELLQHTLHVRSKLSHAEHLSNRSTGIPKSFW